MSDILIVDNYDSFTHNLASLVHALTGRRPDVVKNDEPLSEQSIAEYRAVIISPGPGTPQRAADFGTSRRFADGSSGIPTLGVCLGHQGIGYLAGARVVPAPEIMHGRVDVVNHAGTPLFDGIPERFAVVRYHSLAISGLPAELRAEAWTADGAVMAVSHVHKPLWGVQFHPESIDSTYGLKLVENFLRLAGIGTRCSPGSAAASPDLREPDPVAGRLVPAAEVRLGPQRLRLLWQAVESALSPEDAYEQLFSTARNCFWLDSAFDGQDSRFSYLGDGTGPLAQLVSYQLGRPGVRVTTSAGATIEHSTDIFGFLAARLKSAPFRCAELPFDFLPGYVGYLGYELKALCGGDAAHRSAVPDASLLFADRYLAIDHTHNRTYLVSCYDERDETTLRAQLRWFEEVRRQLAAPPHEKAVPSEPATSVHYARHSDDAYLGLIGDVQESLRQGESYEITLTNRFDLAGADFDALKTYRRLRRAAPAPYGGVYRTDDVQICSNSPELFLRLHSDGWAESRPMKGTTRRGANLKDDAAAKAALLDSAKEIAENRMIVDLVRNDLAQVSVPGSVHVPRLYGLDSYRWVHQLVSHVRGKLRQDAGPVDLIRACFPGGSMTGAPKIRSMQIIDKVEAGPRGPYAGGFGYLSLAGAFTLGMVIRTAVAHDGTIAIGAGGAVTWLSDPTSEVAEMHLKLEGIAANIVTLAEVPERATAD